MNVENRLFQVWTDCEKLSGVFFLRRKAGYQQGYEQVFNRQNIKNVDKFKIDTTAAETGAFFG